MIRINQVEVESFLFIKAVMEVVVIIVLNFYSVDLEKNIVNLVVLRIVSLFDLHHFFGQLFIFYEMMIKENLIVLVYV